jgi:gamma-glutamyltranspeptidase / glutathione hydrolase
MALGIIEHLEKSNVIPQLEKLEHNSTEYLHILIESLRLAFADATWYVTDLDFMKTRTEHLLNKVSILSKLSMFLPCCS